MPADDAAVGAGPHMPLEQGEQLGPAGRVAVDALQALQHSGDVVAGFRVGLDVAEVGRTQLWWQAQNASHEAPCSEQRANRTGNRAKCPDCGQSTLFFACANHV